MTDNKTANQAELRKAIALFQQGKSAEAEKIITQLHHQQPDDFDTLHILGVMALQASQPDRGVTLIGKAIAIKADFAPAHNNLGNGFRTLKRPEDALTSYERAIALRPDFVEAYNNRGNVLIDLKRLDDALASFDRAIALKIDFVAAYSNRGNALLKMNRLQEALASCEKAIALQSDFVEAHVSRGEALLALDQAVEALASFDRAIALKPDYAAAYNNRGKTLMRLGRTTEALTSCEKAIVLQSDLAEAYIIRGGLLLELNRAEEALASYDRALELASGSPVIHNNRGNALRSLERIEEALASYDQAIALRPDFAEAHNNRGNVLKTLHRPDDALASFDKAIALSPDYAAAYSNRGNLLVALCRSEEALASYDRAIALEPDNAKAHSNRGNALLDLKRLDDALESHDRAIALEPGYPLAHWNRSFVQLLAGRFEPGFLGYAWRKKCTDSPAFRAYPPQSLWTGAEDIKDKVLLVTCEQGLGDTIQFCRYARLAETKGAKVILSAQNALARLLKSLSPTIEIIDFEAAPAHFDYHIPLLDMPMAFKTNQNNIPADIPYLRAETDRALMWRDRIGTDGFRIGIGWQGNKLAPADIGRSFSVRHFEPLSKIPNVRLISLQKNTGVDQLADLPAGMKVESFADQLDTGPDAFLDTAAVMENLDLIITSDTAIPHLAGALGRPTWVALKYAPDWRWLLDRSDSPWYPTVKLFRQASYNNWSSAFSEIESEFKRSFP